MRDIKRRFLETVAQKNLLPQNNLLIVAISGGQDSLALLKFLMDFKKKYNWKILVVHFNHNIREDATSNANLVC